MDKVAIYTYIYNDMINFVFIFIFPGTVLFTDPKDVTVKANEWAQFNCTVRCGYTVSWYMAGYSKAIKRNNIVPGLLIKRRRASCTESNVRTHFFEVFATEAFNKSTFYCAAYETRPQENSCSCGTDGRCFSRPALLTGEHIKIATFVFCFLFFLYYFKFCLMPASRNRHTFNYTFYAHHDLQ